MQNFGYLLFILLKWQKSKLQHFVIRKDSEPGPFTCFCTYGKVIMLSLFFVLKVDITQEVFATKILYALLVSAVLPLQPILASKAVAYSNNTMRSEEITILVFNSLHFPFTAPCVTCLILRSCQYRRLGLYSFELGSALQLIQNRS
jgi:hypothetical protein